MILVLSHSKYEQGTDVVLDWLLHYGAKFIKISSQDLVESQSSWYIDVDNNDIIINGISLKSEVNVVWYRRFFDPISFISPSLSEVHHFKLLSEVKNEITVLSNYFFSLLKDKTWLPAYDALTLANNKLQLLNIAQRFGLNIPRSSIISSKISLLNFFHQMKGAIINKPLDYCGYYKEQDSVYTSFTTLMDEAKIHALPDFFFPALFQERITRAFEIRVFYLDGDFFATAILVNTDVTDPSQIGNEYEDVKLHFGSKHTHLINYKLPKEIEKKLDCFMKSMNLNTGSIDIIKSVEDEYFFIEVNPVGQYMSQSVNCNYNLDQKIAKWLITQDMNSSRIHHDIS